MYENINVKLFDIPLRLDLNSLKSLEHSLGYGWQKEIYNYDYEELTNIYSLLMREGLRYYAYMGNIKNYSEPKEEELFISLMQYSLIDLQNLLLQYIQKCTLTEEEIKQMQEYIELEEDDIKPVRGVQKTPTETDFYFYYYFARKEFNFNREETGFLLLVEWKKFYKAYKDKFDIENSLRFGKTTFAKIEADSKRTLNEELGGYSQ